MFHVSTKSYVNSKMGKVSLRGLSPVPCSVWKKIQEDSFSFEQHEQRRRAGDGELQDHVMASLIHDFRPIRSLDSFDEHPRLEHASPSNEATVLKARISVCARTENAARANTERDVIPNVR